MTRPDESSATSTSSTTGQSSNASNGSTWQQDFLASLVVFLVALPLCLGIALASGAPAAAGLVTGIVGGLLVGTFAGSPLQVSGPAAGLTVICAEAIRLHGMAGFGLVVLFAGTLQLVAGTFRFGQWFRAVSPAVIHGMLSGIGLLILCGQLHVLVDERPKETALRNIAAVPSSLLKGVALPTWEEAGVRTARIDLLGRSNSLSTSQRALRGEVTRALLRLQTAALNHAAAMHGVVPGSDSSTPALSSEDLQPYIKEQQRILELQKAIATTALASPGVTTGNALSLTDQMQQVETNLATALSELESGDARRIAASQTTATQVMDAQTASLKSHDWAGKVGLLALLTIIFWQFTAKGRRKLIPGPLLAIVLTTAAAWMFQLPILYVDVPDNLISGMTFPTAKLFAEVPMGQLMVAGFVIAIVASAETLLCATAVDQMHRGPRTRYDQELVAQGLGNLVCGCLGVLPMTGVIVRSAANVQAGGKTRLSSILHGLWLLLFSVALVPVLRMIPTAALAGILVYTGFRLIDFRGFLHLWKEDRAEAGIFLVTMMVIVGKDLLTGVVTGIVLAAVRLLVRFSALDVTVTRNAGQTIIKLTGAATFLRLPALAACLEKIPASADLHIDISDMDFIDRACMDLLQSWARQHAATGGTLTLDWESLHGRFQTPGRKTSQTT